MGSPFYAPGHAGPGALGHLFVTGWRAHFIGQFLPTGSRERRTGDIVLRTERHDLLRLSVGRLILPVPAFDNSVARGTFKGFITASVYAGKGDVLFLVAHGVFLFGL